MEMPRTICHLLLLFFKVLFYVHVLSVRMYTSMNMIGTGIRLIAGLLRPIAAAGSRRLRSHWDWAAVIPQ